MSLTSILTSNSDLTKIIPNLKGDITTWDGKAFNWKTPKLVSSIGASHEAGLIGTAFDYIVRALIAQKLDGHNVTLEKLLMAERGFDSFLSTSGIFTQKYIDSYVVFNQDNLEHVKYDELDINSKSMNLVEFGHKTRSGFKKYSIKMFLEAIEKRSYYIKTGHGLNDLIESSILFAEYDMIYRTASSEAYVPLFNRFSNDIYGFTINNKSRMTKTAMVDNVKELIAVFENTIRNISFSSCILNPSFGEYTTMLNGADADLIIDDVIVDIKTNKKLGYVHEEYAQLLAYAAMGRKIGLKLNRAAIYYARYGVFSVLELNPLNKLLEQYLTSIEIKAEKAMPSRRLKQNDEMLIKQYSLWN
ncbi:MAG: hypothetical protein CVU90_02075 [Firmicutes bacterium HGW-Firmicutes-15]|nr:MAG: hypothetical protein CVU90_02075 [Firmicutes bacterium HGW-Firmicutes-15]